MKIFVIFFFLPLLVVSQSNYADSFLKIGISTRSISVGQAVVAMPSHPQAYLYNPSGAALTKQSSFSLLAVNQFSLADYYSFSLSTPVGEKTVLGFHGVGLLIDHILERPDIHEISDLEARRDTIQALVSEGFSSFSNRETAWTFTLSRKFKYNVDLGWQTNQISLQCPVGANIRFIQKSLHKLNGRGIAFDMGGLVQIPLNDVLSISNAGMLTLGGTLTNLSNTKIFWSSEKEDIIPMRFIWGASYAQDLIFLPSIIHLYYQSTQGSDEQDRYGLEIGVLEKIFIRAGLDEAGLHGGMGFNFIFFQKKIDIGYSFLNHDLGRSHRFDFTLSLN